ncbi:MAG: PAS domain S-box protein, partial [Methanoregula sp.]|nr:PAS domain S-box protein [Methanoregula sp.]
MADKIRVLYVDDEDALRDVGKMFLEWTGSFSVTTALSAREAILVLKNERFDAIVSDYQMPGMNGIDLLKHLKSGGDSTPFVILTGKGREEVVIEALNAGADGYLQKGGEPNAQFAELSHMIKKAVDSRQAEITIRDHERREAEIINFLPDATFAIDTHSTVITWNRAMEEMTGVPAADMLGKGNYEYALPFYHERRPIAIDLVLFYDPVVAAKYPFMTRENNSLVSEIYIPHLNNGSGAYLWFTASPIFDATGNIAGAIESIRDITAKKRAERGLRIARDEYVSLLERITDVYYRTDTEGNLIRASSSLAHALGYDDLSECLGKNIAETFYADPDERRKLLEAIYRDRAVTDYEVTLKKKDGTPLSVATSSYLYFDDTGNVLGIEGTCRDITDRKRAEIALQEREAYYRTIFENTGTASVIIEEDTTISLANAEYVRLSGYSREEIEGKRCWTEFVVPDDLDRMLAEHHKRRSAPQTAQPHYEFRFITKNGEIRIVYLSIDVIPGTKKSVASLLDITNRKRAEDAVRESEERLDLALRSAEMGVWHWDILQNKRTFDLQTCRLLGIDPETFHGSAEEFYAVVHPDDRERLKDAIARTVDEDLLYEPSYRVILADGSVRFVTARCRLVRDAQGRLTRINGIIWDITGLKKSEQALRESEERFRRLAENAPGVLYRISLVNGKFEYVSPAVTEISGYTPQEHYDNPQIIRQVIHPDWLPYFDRAWHSLTMGEVPLTYECPIVDKRGTIHWINQHNVLIRDTDGHPVALEGIITDITEKKQMEASLRESEEKFRTLAESTPVAIMMYQGDLWVYANPAGELISGYSCEELYAMHYWDFVAPEFRQEVKEKGRQRQAGVPLPEAYDFRIIAKDGTEKWVSLTGNMVQFRGKPAGIISVIDITTRKHAEHALRESENRFRALAENSSDIIRILDRDGRIIFDTAAVVRELGYAPGFTIGKSPFEFIHPDDIDTVKTNLSGVYAKTNSGIPTEFRIRRADGSYTWVESTGKNLIGVPGVDGIMTTTRFIDAQKRMESSLHESEKRYRAILEQAADAIFLHDENGKILDVNDKACRNLGYSREELVQMSIGEIDPGAIQIVKHTLWRTVMDGVPITFESRQVRKDGSSLPVEVSLGPVKIAHEWVVLGIVRDITDRKRADAALNASERRFRDLADLLPQIVYETDAQGTLIYTNRIAFELFGYTEEEFRQGLNVMQMLAPVDRERAAQNFFAVVSGQDNERAGTEYLALRKDGSTFPIAIYASRIGEPGGSSGLRGIILDITARKQAEQALIESEERYSSIFNNSDFVSLLIDPDTARIVDANAAAAWYYGYPADQLTKMGVYDLNRLPKETVIGSLQAAKTEKSQYLLSTHYRASGEARDVEIYSGLITLHQKPHLYSILHDITERKQAEESVKTLRQFQESVIKNAHIWITVLDKHGVVRVWNRAAEEISGYGADEVIGTSTIWSRMYPDKEYR